MKGISTSLLINSQTLQIPLEVTHKALVTDAILGRIRALDSNFAEIILSLLTCFADTYRDVFGFKNGPPLHDPVAVAHIACPDIFKVRCPGYYIDDLGYHD